MVIASNWGEKMPATQQRSTWESVRTQLRDVQMILSEPGECRFGFSVKVFLSDEQK